MFNGYSERCQFFHSHILYKNSTLKLITGASELSINNKFTFSLIKSCLEFKTKMIEKVKNIIEQISERSH